MGIDRGNLQGPIQFIFPGELGRDMETIETIETVKRRSSTNL